LKALARARKSAHKDRSCLKSSPCNQLFPTDAREFASQCLCPILDEGTVHALACLQGDCNVCQAGYKTVKFCKHELETFKENVPWSCYERVPIGKKNKDGQEIKHTMLKHHRTPIPELVKSFRDHLMGHKIGKGKCKCEKKAGCPKNLPFAFHCFEQYHQAKQKDLNKQYLKLGEAMCIMDFSENYNCDMYRPAQSIYYTYRQATIHVAVIIRHAEKHVDGVQSTEEHPILIHDHVFVISEDLKHDAAFVEHFVGRLIKDYFQARNLKLKVLHQWTDGCASQYKCAHGFADVGSSYQKYGVKVIRNYFATAHARGIQDAAGGDLKYQGRVYVLWEHDSNRWFNKLLEPFTFFQFCDAELRLPRTLALTGVRSSKVQLNLRVFYWTPLIGEGAVNRPKNEPRYKTVRCTRKLHSVRAGPSPNSLYVRDVTCYCKGCYLGVGSCENSTHVDNWRVEYLVADNNAATRAEEDFLQKYCEARSDVVTMGMVFAVLGEGDVWLAQATGELETLTKSFTDSEGQCFAGGDHVIKCKYFEFLDDEDVYVYELKGDEHETCMFPHLVTCVNVVLTVDEGSTPECTKYRISYEERERERGYLNL
jgi:hypothetical protein